MEILAKTKFNWLTLNLILYKILKLDPILIQYVNIFSSN